MDKNNINSNNSNEISCDIGITNMIKVEENDIENTDSVMIEDKSCNITNIIKVDKNNIENTDSFYVNGKDCYMPGTTDNIKYLYDDNKTNGLVFDSTDTISKESTQETAINEPSDIPSDSINLSTTSLTAETTVKNASVDFVSDSTRICETRYPTCNGQEEHINETFQEKSHHQRKQNFKQESGSSSMPSIKVFIKKPNNNTVSQTVSSDTESKSNGISYFVLKVVPKTTPPKVKKFNASCQTRRYPNNQTSKPSILKRRKNTGNSDKKSDTVVEKQSKCNDVKSSAGTCNVVKLSDGLDCTMTSKTKDDSRSDIENNTEYAVSKTLCR